ncbi:DUF4875 domain-containing protein [Marinomonas mediterranea]|jgi:hypothetical protein|uniref:DUF4875 domain-containing protein n=1 Tax=Marinomonas mediterranea (strain ATCC 700492 / JCM 21426 / NBRC 103028 / MMB-1) TaxID=717774 RepID=F2JW10_MARM1|nr:hypothetical protein [Marinomonas mediterranea]ADZ92898.1 hypothetical protein Marme_3687 [Marinomonas mediterranea MMB-1]WCN18920.1 hypothetical protein GV053_18675 [Marinomonas mediterranea MMB-1]
MREAAGGCLVFIVLAAIVLLFMKSCGGDSQEELVESLAPNAQDYVVLASEEYATPSDKKGLKFTIYSEDSYTFEKRGQTLIKAAYDLLEDKDLYEVVIRLSALPSIKPKYIHAGLINYHPHKEDTWGNKKEYIWNVTASPNKIIDGQLEEDGKLYPLKYMAVKSYLKK